MHRYFVDDFDGTFFKLEFDNLNHAKNVVKLNISEKIICIMNGKSYLSEIFSFNENYILAKKIDLILNASENNIKINLIACIIRESKWDFILQKATELGVNNIIPMQSNRSVVKISNEKITNKILRWQKICEDAAEQSNRNVIPKISNVIFSLKEILPYLSEENIIAYENEKNKSLKSILSRNFKSITIIIGPEGGFDQEEINEIINMGFSSVTLGKKILRAETASIFALSCLLYEKEL